MNNLKWETLQQLIGKERFTLSELIPALIDNQEELKLLDDDLEHIIAITFRFSTDANNCLIFTTFSGILNPRDLAEARQIIKDYRNPVVITENRYEFYLTEEIIDGQYVGLETGGKDLNKAFVVGIDKAKEGGDSTSFVIYDDLTPIMKELAEERRKTKEKRKVVEVIKQASSERYPLFLRNPNNKKV